MEFALITLAVGLPSLGFLVKVLTVAVGLGLVIFFHELGHFMVAKWCGVYVERFSIGFGQPIIGKKWGETEYVLGWLPFGGYVKMLGQDDMDPAQMTDDQVAENPRSYTAKSVPQRMAIISAGVIMNIITGMLFFMLVFHWGIMRPDHVVGMTLPGGPAWESGIRAGDTITEINNRSIREFTDIMRRTALSVGPIEIRGFHADGETYQVSVVPDKQEILKIIGISPAKSLTLYGKEYQGKWNPTVAGSPAAKAGFEFGDQIVSVAGEPVDDSWELVELMRARKSEPVDVVVKRTAEDGSARDVTLSLPPQPMLDFGLRMNIGKVSSIQQNSLAARAGLRKNDQIVKVDGQDVVNDMNPLRLSEYFSEHAGEEVEVVVTRERENGPPEEVALTLIPEDVNPWLEPPVSDDLPLSIPSIGAAYHLVPAVAAVEPDSPADKLGIKKRDTISRVVFKKAGRDSKESFMPETIDVKINEKSWASVFWSLQIFGRSHNITLEYTPAEGSQPKTVQIEPREVGDWYLTTYRGLRLAEREIPLKAANVSEAARMGLHYTAGSIEDIYLTLRGLFTRNISPKGLSGPIDIARTAYMFADQGLADFVLFLGLISVNLAVINFLPIPVLDGGHMVFLIWEAIFRRKPSERVVATATYFGLALVLSLMIFVIVLDLSKTFS